MRDGVLLAADHFVPVTARPRGTVLIRTPYGRGFPTSNLNGRMFAARGYHVVIQSVRGTFGSGGTFEPMAQETNDGQDTIEWLRSQAWFDGRLATLGGSYLGWTQWTVLQDPPPEIKTAIVYVSPHDFRQAVFGRGAFTLGDFLSWTNMITTQENGGPLSRLFRGITANRTLAPIMAGLPLPDAADPLLRGRAPWYRTWLSHPDGDDPWWEPYRAGAALDRVSVPVLLVGGWQDLFLDQTLEQYTALRDRGVEVAVTIGPWTHLDVGTKGARVIHRESMAWLDTHLAGDGPVRKDQVQVFRTGEGAWHSLASWPPPTATVTYQLSVDGTLAPTDAVPDPDGSPDAVVSFRFDPTDPTPSVGGRTLSGSMGVKDNRALEARPDVVTFTSPPLTTAVDVTGHPTVELAIAVDNPHADVFARLCDVDERGRSHNFSDHLHRLDPAVPAGRVQHLTLRLDPCFHRLRPGHRLRLQVSGGAFPRYARNLGTDGSPAEGRVLKPSRHEIHPAGCRITLPVSPSSDGASTTR
jgi:putative CocE/NonD family hydrolase